MSLKAFHVFFILVSILFSGAMSAWAFMTGASEGVGWGAAISAVALLVYGFRFVRSARSIIL